jgi:hypothetical protein
MTMDIDEEWENFISAEYEEDEEIVVHNTNEYISANVENDLSLVPIPSNIYISTKTKIAYLNKMINLKSVFWNIPLIPYAKPCNGVIKKQMKFNSVTKEDYIFIKDQLLHELYFEELVINHVDNPTGRIKFKDTRKVSIGICKKDIMNHRCKKKSAFYNCFVLIIRMELDNTFKEFHVKVFNTGKLEIPGVQNEVAYNMLLTQVADILRPFITKEPILEDIVMKSPLLHINDEPFGYKENSTETVLINSNFNCGFYIDREALYDILKFKYNIQSIYDPCSYPGIQCKFYYNPEVDLQNGCQITEENIHLYKNINIISFMIFRTGSVLIVGRCDEDALMIIYEFLKIILKREYSKICQKNMIMSENYGAKDKKKKTRRKNITIETEN